MALQLRRGTDAERQGITPKEGELIYVTDTNRLWVGGKIAPNQSLEQGGILVSGSLVNDTNPTLAADLDLNGNNITGNGNISINGTITATGTVNLGDGVEDNVVVGGQIGSSLIPGTDRSFDLGASTSAWRTIYTSTIDAETSVNAGDVYIKGSIAKDDSTVIYNGETGGLSVTAVSADTVVANQITGNLTGSVFGDDSTLLVDGISKVISNSRITIDNDTITGTVLGGDYENNFASADTIIAIGTSLDAHTLFVEGDQYPIIARGISSASTGPTISIQSVRYTNGVKETVQENDFLGQFAFDAEVGATDMKRAALLTASVESAVGGTNFDTDLTVSVLRADGLYSQFTFEADGRFSTVANSYTALPDAVLPSLVVPAGSVGYGSDREAIVVFDGTSFKTVPTFIGVPSGPTDTGKAGQVSADADYMYICHSTDNWIRVAKDATWT
jgi:hypothetical protein